MSDSWTPMTSNLYLEDSLLQVDTPYVPAEVAALKAIPGAKWNKRSKRWEIPLRELGAARDFVTQFGYTMSDEVARLTLPLLPAEGVVDLPEGAVGVKFPYEPVMIRGVKQIPGVTWSSKDLWWVAPETSLREVIVFADRFGLMVPDVVRQREDTQSREREAVLEASRSVDAEVEVPGLRAELLPYQRAGVAYLTAVRRGFLADDMGLGKTVQAIATMEVLHAYPLVVVCPPSLVLNWQKEYARWLPHRDCQVVVNRREFPQNYEVLVVGYSNIWHWGDSLRQHHGYVFDESHYCKSKDAQRTKAARRMVRSAKDVPVLLLTGTPITNRPAEYAPQLDILGVLDKFGGEWGFYRRYCDAFRDRWGQWHLEGASNLEELNDRLRATCYIRRTKDQVLDELPPVVHDPVVVDGTVAGMKEYRRAEADVVKYLMDRAAAIASELGLSPRSAAVQAKFKAEAAQHLVTISVLRRLAAKAKMPVIEEWIDSRVADGRKVVVAAHHRDVVDMIANKYGGYKIQGGMDVREVEAVKAEFQTSPDAKVMVLSIQAAKTGHTLTASQDVLFVELPWTPADVDQTYSRCHRLGQLGSVTATYLLAAGTIDEAIYEMIEKKRDVVDRATEGVDSVGDDVGVGGLLVGLLAGVSGG